MRTLTILALTLFLAACSTTESQHPGKIGGEQATKNSSLSIE